ncbi:thioredoxin family protein [Methylophilus sp. Q8]|uniref:thioredoxin family protein n=1 Tax=Methylophilus sp. Q8 TaxID=1506586 RepID=UPI000646F00C|nr:thioredoxin family protein [Methylophilus sp. Q8]
MNVNNLYPIDSQAAFNQQVTAHDFMVVLFTAKWCAPCQTFAPVFAEVAAQTPHILFATVDMDVATDLAANFQVAQVPALMVVRERVVIDLVNGAMHAHELKHHLHMWQALDMAAINAHFAQRVSAS